MKKVLSLVLTLALVLSSFSLAFADDAATATAEPTPAGKAGMNLSDVAKSPNKEAIGVVNDLGIVIGTPEGTFLPEKDVTRAEFAAMITRALAIPKSALEGYQQTPFKDMAGYEWANGYIAFCVSKGIMVGDGMGNAMPGRTVTLNEAVTMALRAVGYVDNSSELKGAWPANFVTKAQELNLYDRVAKDSVVANRETAAQLIYNVLTVQKVAVDTDGQTKKLFESYNSAGVGQNPINLLTAGLNAADDVDTIVSVSTLEDSSINLAKYLGKMGTLYKSKNTKKAIAFMPEKDYVTLVGRITEGGKKFVTTEDETTYTFELETGGVVPTLTEYQINGEKQTTPLSLSNATLNDKEVVLFAELKGKTIKKPVAGSGPALILNMWVVSEDKMVDSTDLSDIKNARLLGKKFEKDDKVVDTKRFVLNGAATLEDIKADNVVYVYEADKKIVRVDVGTETAEGTVNKFKQGSVNEGTAAVFKIGDKEYKNAASVSVAPADPEKTAVGVLNFAAKDADTTSVTPEYLTDDVKVALDFRGFVYDVTKSNRADKYALVIKEDSVGLDHRAKLLLADGTEKVVDVKLEGNANLRDLDDGNNTGIVAYGMNKDGKVTEKDSTILVTQFAEKKINFKSNSVAVAVDNNKHYNIKKDAPVFMYKDGAIGGIATEYSVTSMDKVTKELNKSAVRILYKEDKIYALLVSGDDAKSGDSKYAVVNVADRENKDNTKVLKVEGFIDGVAFTKYTDAHYAMLFGHSESYADSSSRVELFDVTLSKDDVITGVKLVDKNANSATLVNTDTEHNTRFVQVAETNDRKAIKLDDKKYLAVADNAVFYKLNSDADYEVFTGAPRKGDYVKAYELNKELGYDVVFVVSKDDADKVSVQGQPATAGDGQFTVTNAGKYIVKSGTKYYNITGASGGALIEKTDHATAMAAATTEINAGAVVTGLDNTADYQLILIKEAYVKVKEGTKNTIKAKKGANNFDTTTLDSANNKITLVLVGAVANGITAIGDIATTNTNLATDSHVNLTLPKNPENGKNEIELVAANDGTAFTKKDPAVEVTIDVDNSKVTAVEYDGGDIYYIVKTSRFGYDTSAASADKVMLHIVD